MKSSPRLLVCALSWLLLLPSTGCFRNPKVRMQKYYDSGLQYAQKGKYQEAAIQFQNAIQIDKNFADAHYQLARCFLQQGLWPNAYRELRLTIDLAPQNLPAQLDLANLYFGGRRFEDAKQHADEILKQDPNDLGAQLLLASSDAELSNFQAAIQEAQRAVELGPDKPT